MQFIAVTIALLAAAVSAAPVTTTTVQFTNDNSGRSANVVVSASGVQQSVAGLLAGTPLDNNHVFLATSFFLQSNFQGVTCQLYTPGYYSISEQNTFAHIAPVSAPLDLASATIVCYRAIQ